MMTSKVCRLASLPRCQSSPIQLSRRGLAQVLPRVTERRAGEGGPGGRNSNAGVKVAIFGASSFLGRYVCGYLGTFTYVKTQVFYFHVKVHNKLNDVKLFVVWKLEK